MSRILTCGCRHAYQDAQYGSGKRVHNVPVKSDKCRCTVCGIEKVPPTRSDAPEPTKGKKAKNPKGQKPSAAARGEAMSKNAPAEPVFWDCQEPERLSHESVEEALEYYFDSIPDGPILDVIAQHSPVAVKGYARDAVHPAEASSAAERALERFEEDIADEYGDPDGRVTDLLDAEHRKTLLAALTAAFEAALSHVNVWRCSVVERRVLSAAEVEAILRERAPEWFEEAPDAAR